MRYNRHQVIVGTNVTDGWGTVSIVVEFGGVGSIIVASRTVLKTARDSIQQLVPSRETVATRTTTRPLITQIQDGDLFSYPIKTFPHFSTSSQNSTVTSEKYTLVSWHTVLLTFNLLLIAIKHVLLFQTSVRLVRIKVAGSWSESFPDLNARKMEYKVCCYVFNGVWNDQTVWTRNSVYILVQLNKLKNCWFVIYKWLDLYDER